MKKTSVSLLLCLFTLLFGFTSLTEAQIVAREQVYSVTPDLRRCVFPLCGGWYINPVNIATLDFQDEEQATVAPQQFAPIYVARINYKALGLSKEQIQKFEQEAYAGKALVRGYTRDVPYWTTQFRQPIKELVASGTWLAANNNPPFGPYLNVKSSGIVCITTPCPYYEAELINTSIYSLFDDLNFERARLTREQEARAWRAVAEGGLFMTAITYPFKGMAGEGTGLAATQVYFSYPK